MLEECKLINDTVQDLRELCQAYRRYFNSPHDLRWRVCESAYEKVMAELRAPELGSLIDPIIAVAVKNGHGTPDQAVPNLREAEPLVIRLEQRMGLELGYKPREIRRLYELACKVLDAAQREGKVLEVPRTTQALADHLESVHNKVRTAYKCSIKEPRRKKNARRKEACEQLDRHLYVVGAIVANAAEQGLFAYSYALSIGVYGAPARKRRVLHTKAAERKAA